MVFGITSEVVIHPKNLVGISEIEPSDLNKFAHEPICVPESMLISHLFYQFQTVKERMVFEVNANRATRVRLTIPISLKVDSSDKPGQDQAI